MKSDMLELVNCLAEEVGKFIEYWGFKSIHGKVWTHLYLSSEPLDAGELIRRLQISKSLASITINDLLRYNVILPKGKGPRDTQVYVANPNIREVILEVLRSRETQMMSRVQQCYQQLVAAHNEEVADLSLSTDKLTALGQMINQANHTLKAMLELREVDFNKVYFGEPVQG